MDEAALATVCLQVAKPMKKVVRKTFEEAVFLVSLASFRYISVSPELGCSGFAISLQRCQGFKVCRKTTKEVTKNKVTGRNESKNNAVKNRKVIWY